VASIVKRKRNDGTPSYYVKYRAGDGRVRWERFASAKDARARKAAVEVELARTDGTWSPPAHVTFETVAEAWYARKTQALRPQTLANYRSALDVWLLPAFGSRPIASLRRSDVEGLRAKMAAACKGANTIKNVSGVLRRVLDDLVADRQLAFNAAALPKRGKRPGRAPRKIVVPSHEEVDRLLAAARPTARPALEVAASLGLRRAELLTLRWADVDFEAREIRVRESKTDAGERAVPMFGSARRVLLEQKARSRFKRPEDFVFPTAVGTAERPADWARREYLYARRQARLRETMRLHDLRHYAVSRLIEQAANVLLVSKVAGHARPSVTLGVYSHLFADGLREAADRFDPLAREQAGALAVDER
jgi:integrase